MAYGGSRSRSQARHGYHRGASTAGHLLLLVRHLEFATPAEQLLGLLPGTAPGEGHRDARRVLRREPGQPKEVQQPRGVTS